MAIDASTHELADLDGSLTRAAGGARHDEGLAGFAAATIGKPMHGRAIGHRKTRRDGHRHAVRNRNELAGIDGDLPRAPPQLT